MEIIVLQEILSFLIGLILVCNLGVVLCYWAFPAAPVQAERKLERRIEYTMLVLASLLPLAIFMLF